MAASSRQYAPGERAPVSGIYRVIHKRHRQPHFVAAIQGEEFPRCRKCSDEVRFQLAKIASYVNHDWDLAGPDLLLMERPPKAS